MPEVFVQVMKPNERTLSRLKEEIYLNAVRFFIDGCILYRSSSYASALAFAILAVEEIGKLKMIDHVCDDISLNRHVNGQEFIGWFFNKKMLWSHRMKQVYAEVEAMGSKSPRIRAINAGKLEEEKQDALYVGYRSHRLYSPRLVRARRAYDELKAAHRLLRDVDDLGFNGFDCWPTVRSKRRARSCFKKVDKHFRMVESILWKQPN